MAVITTSKLHSQPSPNSNKYYVYTVRLIRKNQYTITLDARHLLRQIIGRGTRKMHGGISHITRIPTRNRGGYARPNRTTDRTFYEALGKFIHLAIEQSSISRGDKQIHPQDIITTLSKICPLWPLC